MKCYKCKGCGNLVMDESAYLAEIRSRGAYSCCPETRYEPYDTGQYDLERMDFSADVASRFGDLAFMFRWSETPQGDCFWSKQSDLHDKGKDITQSALNAINDMLKQHREEGEIHGYAQKY